MGDAFTPDSNHLHERHDDLALIIEVKDEGGHGGILKGETGD